MKKLIGFLIVAALVGCKCIGQLPIQVLPVGDSCTAILPDYREHITVRDNCAVTSIVQSPLPGTVLDATNPYVKVTIIATDISNNKASMEFDVVIDDDEPPVIEIDSSFWFTYEPVDRSPLLRAYHTMVGLDMYNAAQGPDSIWTHSLLRDTSYWEPNPWLDADSVFDTKGMMMRWEPGFNATSVGSFIESDRYVLANLDSTHLKTLGLWPVMTVTIGVESMPLEIDAAGESDNWFTQEEGGIVFKFAEAPWGLDDMYKSERYGVFKYKIPVGEGTYVVDLHFCEIYWDDSGSRVFDVNIQGERVLTGLDILSEVAKWTPLVKTFTIEVEFGGFLEIDFPTAIEDYAKISGITVRKLGTQASLW